MPTSKKTISERQFQALVRKFKRLQDKAEADSKDSKLETYWSYGELIENLRLSEDIGYHNSVLQDLSRETGISLRTLQHSVAFRKTYTEPPESDELSWSHFRVLARLSSAKQRNFYTRLARKERWTSKELQSAIASDLYSGGELSEPELKRPAKPSYLYKVKRVRVIDGDTIEALVDLGFGTFSLQRIRLAQLDSPDVRGAAGRVARNFLVEAFAGARTIVVQTHKADVHGRYVGHIFTSPRKMRIDECFASGVHINDLLVREKHARVIG